MITTGVAVAACGGQNADSTFLVHRCATSGTAALNLALSDIVPAPHRIVIQGAIIRLSSSLDGNQMSLPKPTSSNGLCEVSQHLARDGTATVLYRLQRPGSLVFTSGLARQPYAGSYAGGDAPTLVARVSVVPRR